MKAPVIALALVASLGLMSAGGAHAQTAERTYNTGSVWLVTYVETKSGMFDDYMVYLGTTWRDQNEADKRTGRILDYKILSVDQPRDGEANVILLIEFKNMAAFDRPLAETEATAAKAFGTVVKSNQATAARDEMRTMRGALTAHELHFIK